MGCIFFIMALVLLNAGCNDGCHSTKGILMWLGGMLLLLYGETIAKKLGDA